MEQEQLSDLKVTAQSQTAEGTSIPAEEDVVMNDEIYKSPTENKDGEDSSTTHQEEGPRQNEVEESPTNDGFAKPKNTFISPTFRAPKRTLVSKGKKSLGKSENGVSKKENLETQGQSIDNNKTFTEENLSEKIKVESKTEASKAPKQQIPYKAPSWSAICTENYYFDVLKGGVMKDSIDLSTKDFYIFGRLEECDVTMEHPSVSRYHAVVVYRGKSSNESSEKGNGFYIMDLGSTHGTFLNKKPLDPKIYYRLRVGYVVKFGGSTRLYILQGPEEDQDEEIDKSTFEIRKDSKELKEENEVQSLEEKDVSSEQDDGVSWGFDEDAVEEEIDLEKVLASRKPLELKDPKKTLRGFFEREGLDLEYETDERGSGSSKVYVARVRLPIENAAGEEIIAEGSASKKKEAVAACAYEACRIIDAHGMLRNAMHESERSKRAKKLAENDFYDSDEDSFLDRTGSVEKKRQKRLKRAGKGDDETVETYDSLIKLLNDAVKEIDSLQKTLEEDNKAGKEESSEEIDELDRYMNTVSSRLDKKTKVAIKLRLTVLYKEKKRLEKLIEIVKPVSFPPFKTPSTEKLDSKDGSKVATQDNKTDKQGEESQNVDLQNETKCTPELQTATKIPQEQTKTSETLHHAVAEKKPRHTTSVASCIHRIESEEERKDETETIEAKPRPKKVKKKKVYGAQMAPPASESKFADWVPPKGQIGDGKTHLNDKFGY